MNELEIILEKINGLFNLRKNIIIAIDGRCAAGKTTLAAALSEKTNCCVIHTDDFQLDNLTGIVKGLIKNLSSQAQRTSLRQSFVAACVKNP